MKTQQDWSNRELAHRIRQWFEALLYQAPEGDLRRTPDCISIPEAVTCARNEATSEQKRSQHIAVCAFCQSAIAIASRVLEEQRQKTQISDQTQWTEALRLRLRQWVSQHQAEEGCPVKFDAQGTVHVHWQGLPKEGHVRLSLVWGETPLPLGSGVVRGGTLTLSRPLPHLGLRDVQVSQRLLRLEWEPAHSSALSSSPSQRREEKPNHSKENHSKEVDA